MSTYNSIAQIYEKWSSGDAAYEDSGRFYVSVLSQMRSGHYLELGIGTGRIAREVIRLSPISITGIDASTEMLKLCKKDYEKCTDKIGTLYLSQADFSEMTYTEQFDGAIMPFRTIGHLLTNNEMSKFFDNVYAALKPGGWFLLDHYMFQRSWAEEHNNVKIVMYHDNDVTIYDYYQYDFQNGLMHCLVYVNDDVFGSFDFRWIEPEEISRFAQKAGFRVLSRMGEFDGSPWDPHSYEQIWFFQKPGNSLHQIQLPRFDQGK